MNTEQPYIYTAEDIKKYLEGKLSAAQMYAIEKAALNDPFLAEAIEGYESYGNTDWQKQLQTAKEALAQKNATAKVIPLSTNKKIIWRVAAAVMLISGLAVAYNLINNKATIQPKEIAKNNIETPANIDSESKKDITVVTEAPVSTTTAPTKQTDKLKEKPNETIATRDEIAPGKTDYVAVINDDLAKQRETERKITTEIVTTPAAPIASEAAKSDGDAVAKKEMNDLNRGRVATKPAVTSNYNFTSQVFASDNSPLPFANVTIEKDDFGTYADVKGNFRLNSTDSFVTVLVKSAGYQPRYYTLNHKTAVNKIVLQEAVMNNDQVIVASSKAKGKPSRKATFLKDTIINVEPTDGWANYGTYISNNIDLPDEIGKDVTKSRRALAVSFEVTATGAITNIKVDNSNCNGCDVDAVKKAIQQGPQWKPKSGKSGSAKITVQF